jgi:hypothetical protein
MCRKKRPNQHYEHTPTENPLERPTHTARFESIKEITMLHFLGKCCRKIRGKYQHGASDFTTRLCSECAGERLAALSSPIRGARNVGVGTVP